MQTERFQFGYRSYRNTILIAEVIWGLNLGAYIEVIRLSLDHSLGENILLGVFIYGISIIIFFINCTLQYLRVTSCGRSAHNQCSCICEYPGMWVAQYRIMLACSVATFFSRLQATTVPSNLSRHPRRGIDLSIHSFYGNVEGDAFRIKLCATSIDGILSPALYGKVLEGESYEIRVTLTPDISSLLFSIIYLLFMALLAMVGPDLLGIPFILIITFAIDAFVLIGYAFFYMDARKKGLTSLLLLSQ